MVASDCYNLILYKKHYINKCDLNRYCTTWAEDSKDKEWKCFKKDVARAAFTWKFLVTEMKLKIHRKLECFYFSIIAYKGKLLKMYKLLKTLVKIKNCCWYKRNWKLFSANLPELLFGQGTRTG